MPPKGVGQAYFREIATKEVWQPFWTWLLNMHVGFHILIPVTNTSTGDTQVAMYTALQKSSSYPIHFSA